MTLIRVFEIWDIIDLILNFDVMQLGGSGFEYVFLLTMHTCGGILVAWCTSTWEVVTSSTRPFWVSIRLCPAAGGPDWWLTTVYGPSRGEDKPVFLVELHELQHVRAGLWLLRGDFNMIYRAQDKNNDRVNRWRMGHFVHFLNSASVQEAHLIGRLFHVE
jgi:hypothetical protein